MAPIVSWGLALSAVGYCAWRVLTQGSLPLTIPVYAVSFVYVAASIWVVVRMVSTAARRDWLIASMSIMPVPFLAFWFVFFYNQEAVLSSKGQMFYGVDTTAAIVFLILAATTALFFRVSRRMVRIVLLVVTVPSMAVLAWMSYQGGPGYMALFTLASMSAAVVVGPVLLDLKAGQGRVQVPAPEETG